MKTTKLSGIHWGVAAGLVMALPQVAQAEGFWQGRASLSPGQYTYQQEAAPQFNRSAGDTDGDIIAADVGAAFGLKMGDGSTLVFDVELEALTIDSDVDSLDFERTDFKASAGWVFDVGVNLTPFLGLRYAWQGDGYFNDDFYTESGFLAGVGLSGLSLSENLSLALSIAFNDSTLDADLAETDASGYSLKLAVRPSSIPVAFSLKYQYFDVDLDASGFGGFEEEYLTLSATWYFAQGAL